MNKKTRLSRRALIRALSIGIVGTVFTGSKALLAACPSVESRKEAVYPATDLRHDHPMPVSFSDVLDLPAEAPDEISSYGPAPQQFGELWRPATAGPWPLVVLIHGGCWQSAYDIAHIRPAAAALRRAGFLVWSIEYRRIGDPGGAWPGTFDDVGLAVDHLAKLTDTMGLETLSCIFMGHSAGGQLALWAAARFEFPPEHPFHSPDARVPDAVFGLAAITDLRAYAAGESSCEQSTVALLGSPQAQESRYAATSPVDWLPRGVAITLVQGRDDPIVPLSQAESFHQKARQAGETSMLLQLPGAGHFDLIHPGTAAWGAILSALKDCS